MRIQSGCQCSHSPTAQQHFSCEISSRTANRQPRNSRQLEEPLETLACEGRESGDARAGLKFRSVFLSAGTLSKEDEGPDHRRGIHLQNQERSLLKMPGRMNKQERPRIERCSRFGEETRTFLADHCVSLQFAGRDRVSVW